MSHNIAIDTAPTPEDFKSCPLDEIPYRFVLNNKRKLQFVSKGTTFEEVKKMIEKIFVEVKKSEFGLQFMVLEYVDLKDRLCFITNQEQWETFNAGPMKRIKEQRLPLAVIAKRPKKKRKLPLLTEQPKKKRVKKKKPYIITESKSYKTANFRGVLLEYFQKAPDGKDVKLDIEVKPKTNDNPNYYATVKLTYRGVDYTGKGYAPHKKACVHFAALDIMLQLKLVTPEELLQTPPTDKDTAKETPS